MLLLIPPAKESLLPGDQQENRHRETLRGGEKGRLAAYSGAQGRTWRCFPWVFFMVLISWTRGWGSRYPEASVDKEKEKPVLSSSGPGTRQPGKTANFQTIIIVWKKAPQIQPRHQLHLHHKGRAESLHFSLPPRQGGDTDGGVGSSGAPRQGAPSRMSTEITWEPGLSPPPSSNQALLPFPTGWSQQGLGGELGHSHPSGGNRSSPSTVKGEAKACLPSPTTTTLAPPPARVMGAETCSHRRCK